jgi:hypothetical protein
MIYRRAGEKVPRFSYSMYSVKIIHEILVDDKLAKLGHNFGAI